VLFPPRSWHYSCPLSPPTVGTTLPSNHAWPPMRDSTRAHKPWATTFITSSEHPLTSDPRQQHGRSPLNFHPLAQPSTVPSQSPEPIKLCVREFFPQSLSFYLSTCVHVLCVCVLCMCMCVGLCNSLSLLASLSLSLSLFVFVCIRACVVWVHVCVLCKHMCAYLCIFVYTCVYMCMYMCVLWLHDPNPVTKDSDLAS